jgi:[protein-PII] uridylyltransferase
MSESVESGLKSLYAEATNSAFGGKTSGQVPGVALAAVGSLARREIGPRSDIDLVLIHDGKTKQINSLAEKIWYPLWDARIRIDHSVRTPAECSDIAGRELSAGLGLLDLRAITGDASLVTTARSSLLDAWRNNARRRLPELLASLDERLAAHGDAAYLLEPDLKEARGGIRDMTTLRALAASWLTDRPHLGVDGPYGRLLDVRDALHVSSGRALDRLLASEAADVAERLGFPDTDSLHREVSLVARRIGHAVDLTVRAASQVIPQRRVLSFARRERAPAYSQEAHGLIVHQGEVGLDRRTKPSTPLLGLHAGALAARRGLVLSPVTAENLGRHGPPIEDPWQDEARDAFLEMLATGENLLPVWEALDLAGCIPRWVEGWEAIRARPQYNPVHRHTVDRHSIQTVAEAQRHLTGVERPDLLLLAGLFHDIGKLPGVGPEHPVVGAPIARRNVERMGLPAKDADLVEHLVRHHLTLAMLATKRDHSDPATLDALAQAVEGRAEVLRLLRALTEADARAAGPAAWSPWRSQLITALTDRCEGLLVGEDRHNEQTELVDLGLARSVQIDGRPRIKLESKAGGIQLIIAATDRLGLFSETAGLLASHSVQVRSAVLTTVNGVAVNTWRVDKQLATDLPDLAFLIKQLERLQRGDTTVLQGLRRRESRVQTSGSPGSNGHAARPYVDLIEDASATAVVVEVRTGDRAGLLYTLGQSLAAERLSIRSAHISTLAGQAIDTFYLTEADGSRPNAQRAQRAVSLLTEAASVRQATEPASRPTPP